MDVRFKYLIYAPMSEYSEWPAMAPYHMTHIIWPISHEYGGMLFGNAWRTFCFTLGFPKKYALKKMSIKKIGRVNFD